MERFAIANIKSVDTTTDPRLLEDNVVARFENAYLQKSGLTARTVARAGVQRSISPISSTTTYPLLKGWMVKDDTGNYRHYFATTNGVHYNNNGNVGNVYSETLTEVGGIIRYNDKMVVVDGKAPKLIGNLFNTPTVQNLVLAAPDISNVEITSSSTHTQNKALSYVLTYFTADGLESPPSTRFGIAKESFGTLTFNNLPVPTNPNIVGKRLYRAAQSVFYKVVDLAVNETTYTDVLTDNELDYATTPNYLINLQTAKFGLLHKNRLFLANFSYKDTNPFQLIYMPAFLYDNITVTQNSTTVPSTNRVGVIPKPRITVTNFGDANSGNGDNRAVFLPYMKVTVNKTSGIPDSSGNGRTIAYKIYLRTADGRYSDVVLSTEVFVKNLYPEYGRYYFSVQLSNLWTAFFGSDRYQPFPEHTHIEVYATSLNYANKYRRIKTLIYNPTIYIIQVDDNGNSEADNLDLPTINPPSTEFYPSGVVYSDPEQLGLLLYGNKFIVESEVGGKIQGMAETTDGVWIIKENAIYKIFTESLPSSWRLYKIADIGATYSHSIATKKGIAAFIYRNSIYMLSDNGLQEVGYPIRKYFEELTSSGYVPVDAVITDKYIAFHLFNSSTNDNQILIYDLTFNIWYVWLGGILNTGTFNSSRLYEDISRNEIGQLGLMLEMQGISYEVMFFDANASTDFGSISYITTITSKTLDSGIDFIRPIRLRVRGQASSAVTIKLNNTNVGTSTLPADLRISNTFAEKFQHTQNITISGTIQSLDIITLDYNLHKGI